MCTAEHLAQLFGGTTAFAGLACVLHEEGAPGAPTPRGCGPEVVCWHACLRTWPPEDPEAAWAAAKAGGHPTEDCGRVRHSPPGAAGAGGGAGGAVHEWYEYDLTGEGYEELWRRLPPAEASAAGGGGDGGARAGEEALLRGSAALARVAAAAAGGAVAPFELLVVSSGRFGYFRDNRPPSLLAELRALAAEGDSTLEALLLDASRPLEWRRAAVDVECSVGRVAPGWRIEHSLFPWRVGRQLEVACAAGLEPLEAGASDGAAAEALMRAAGALREKPAAGAPPAASYEAVD